MVPHPHLLWSFQDSHPSLLYLVSCFLRVFELVGRPGLPFPLTDLRGEWASKDCVSQRAGMNSPSEGERRGLGSLRTSQILKLALGTGMLGLQGTTAVKRNHETRKENAPCPTPTTHLARPLHLPLGSPQLLTYPQNHSGQVHKAGQWESPSPSLQAVIFLPGDHRKSSLGFLIG